jgi:polyribonucleotide nucleotidyltransferase
MSIERELAGRTLKIETGNLAFQTDGAVTVSYGDTVVFVCAVSQTLKEDPGFLPLTVEYREKTFAAGKIPGGFYKREGKPTTKEILTMRLIDRPIRPLFANGFRDEVQITASVFSADRENDPDIPAMIGASAALSISPSIPFVEPEGSVRIGRINGEFVLNPTYSQIEDSDLNLVVTGTENAIIMVEGSAKEIPENIILDAIFWGHQYIKEIVAMQRELVAKLHIPEAPPVTIPPLRESLMEYIYQNYYEDMVAGLSLKIKKERGKALSIVKDKIKQDLLTKEEFAEVSDVLLDYAFEKNQKKIVRSWIKEGKRIDGRKQKEIRPITCEVSVLPRTHGSAIFTRGETQALVTATLGTSMDEQVVEGLAAESTKRFMLHYNFPSFSVGEVRQARGLSRREIGHGALAEKALEAVLPEENRFPYTIRVVSEILSSNGSSSMASVCGGTLALMDAGVPIKRPVGGIAMGLFREDDKFYVLSDIMGAEDQFGDMDFKVAGTQRGVTAVQMDIKIQGISKEILATALKQAKEGRIHILREMLSALDRPKRDISPYAPRVYRIQVNPDKISAVIGSGGKTIRSIQESTGSKIAVQDDGVITIYSPNQEGAKIAQELVEKLTQEVKIGKIYTGKVTSVRDFGAFVEILPGVEGLVHVSELNQNYVQNVSDIVKHGDTITVKVIAIDEQNRIKLSKKAVDMENVAVEDTDMPQNAYHDEENADFKESKSHTALKDHKDHQEYKEHKEFRGHHSRKRHRS